VIKKFSVLAPERGGESADKREGGGGSTHGNKTTWEKKEAIGTLHPVNEVRAFKILTCKRKLCSGNRNRGDQKITKGVSNGGA